MTMPDSIKGALFRDIKRCNSCSGSCTSHSLPPIIKLALYRSAKWTQCSTYRSVIRNGRSRVSVRIHSMAWVLSKEHRAERLQDHYRLGQVMPIPLHLHAH
jgi:arginyl-tRNA--protein-N-Asp/Glu arginylyltransferase